MFSKLLPVLVGTTSALAVAWLVAGCPPPPKPPPTDADAQVIDVVTPESGAADAGDDSDPDGALRSPACKNACLRLRQLGCPEAETPDGGKTCYMLCADAEASGKFRLKPDCVAAAQTVETVRACGTVRCQK